MKDYDKNKESSYIQYWDVNNLNKLITVTNASIITNSICTSKSR